MKKIFNIIFCILLFVTGIMFLLYMPWDVANAASAKNGVARGSSSGNFASIDTDTPTPTETPIETNTATRTQTPTITVTLTPTATKTPTPSINVSKSVINLVNINPGVFVVTYQILVKNTGGVVLNNIQAEDDLKTAFASANKFTIRSVTSGKFTINNGYNGVTNINLLTGADVLAVGQSGSISLMVVVDTAGRTRNYINMAEASGKPPAGPIVQDTDSIDGPYFSDPSISITANVKQVYRGGSVVFTVTVANRGNRSATNVHAIDTLPDILDATSVLSTQGTVTTTGRIVDVSIGNVLPNSVVIITITARVNKTGGTPVHNMVRLTTDAPTDILSNDMDSIDLELIPLALPNTGFAPNQFTSLPAQPKELMYSAVATGEFSLQVPALGITMPIVGVPETDNGWNISWLGSQAGWLNGTAYPSYPGNSVITGHVYLSNGLPGPFVNLGNLKYGDQVILNLSGYRYIYEIQSVNILRPDDISPLRHESLAWLTLITCKQYNEKTNSYNYRTVARAVLVKVTYAP